MGDNNPNNPAQGEGVEAMVVDEAPHVGEAGTQGAGDGVATTDKGKGSAPPGSSEPPGPAAQEGSAAGPSRPSSRIQARRSAERGAPESAM
ncbi:TPA: hypothetical protein ACH3X2_004709 [Trebouxia sp. C0005]|nr:MAG: hypothetical protein FRX49_07299 [Trebouxia sp. A1-2]